MKTEAIAAVEAGRGGAKSAGGEAAGRKIFFKRFVKAVKYARIPALILGAFLRVVGPTATPC